MNCIQQANKTFLEDMREMMPTKDFMAELFKIVTIITVFASGIWGISWVMNGVLPTDTPTFWWISTLIVLGVILLAALYYIICLLDECTPLNAPSVVSVGGDE